MSDHLDTTAIRSAPAERGGDGALAYVLGAVERRIYAAAGSLRRNLSYALKKTS